MDLNQLKSLLSRFHLKPNKLLGQNFLLSEEVLEQIVAAAELTREDTVLEIGPGLGFLTRRLAEKAGRVIAVEKDRKLCRALRKIFSTPSSSPPYQGGEREGVVKIIEGDALDPLLHLPLPSEGEKEKGWKVAANIPYYLTGKILQKFLSLPRGNLLPKAPARPSGGDPPRAEKVSATSSGDVTEAFRPPSLMILLLQKEVAERIIAKPGDMSLLSVSVQFYSDPEIISYVGKENFYPVPEVDSAIVKITPLSSPLTRGERGGVDEKKFFQLVKIGFSNRRKQLQNNLTAGLRPTVIPAQAGIHSLDSRPPIAVEGRLRGNDKSTDYKDLLSSLGLNPQARAQDLSLEDWKRLYMRLFDIAGRFVL